MDNRTSFLMSAPPSSSLIGTHSKDLLRLPTSSHVGIVDLFKNHPGFIMLSNLFKERSNQQNKVKGGLRVCS